MGVDQTAAEMFEKNARFRMIAQSCVAHAIDEAKERIDPDSIRMRDIHEVATITAINVLKRVLTEDAELNAMRIERDHYREVAKQGLRMSPLKQLIPKGELPSGTKE